MDNLKDIVKPLYTECLTAHPGSSPSLVMNQLLSDQFLSINTGETKEKPKFVAAVEYFWRLIPDLKWDVQEMLQDGNKVIVRSIASGSPNGDFNGLKLDGSKSFHITTIDIHTVENDRITQIHHVEDWATAMKQLKA